MNDRLAIYTAILNRYDTVKPIPHQTIPTDWILYTDDPTAYAPGWTVRRIRPQPGEDPKRTATRYKLSPRQVLPDRQRTIWIDGSIAVDSERFAEDMNRLLDNHPLRLFPHPQRSCVYAEAEAVLRQHADIVDVDLIRAQVTDYIRQGVPHNGGLLAGTVVASDHGDERAMEFLKSWLEEVERWSDREQLALGRLLTDFPDAVRPIPAHFCRHSFVHGLACLRKRFQEFAHHECAAGVIRGSSPFVMQEFFAWERFRTASGIRVSNPWMRKWPHQGRC